MTICGRGVLGSFLFISALGHPRSPMQLELFAFRPKTMRTDGGRYRLASSNVDVKVALSLLGQITVQ